MLCQTCSSPTHHLLHITRIHHQALQVASSTAGTLLPTPRALELPGENPEPDFDGGDVWCSRITGNHCWAPETNKQSNLKINGWKMILSFWAPSSAYFSGCMLLLGGSSKPRFTDKHFEWKTQMPFKHFQTDRVRKSQKLRCEMMRMRTPTPKITHDDSKQ